MSIVRTIGGGVGTDGTSSWALSTGGSSSNIISINTRSTDGGGRTSETLSRTGSTSVSTGIFEIGSFGGIRN